MKKSKFYNNNKRKSVVKVSKYELGSKKTCLGVLKRGERDKNNETGLKEGGGIQILTTVLHSL